MISLPCTHSEFEARFPDEAEAAMAYENNRQALHVRSHGTLDGFVAGRTFPCPGILEVTDRRGPQWTVCCSACAFETTVRSPERAPKERTMAEAKW